ncbi:C6 zinc finger protein [Colletotrichum fioriniae PJ7]|uniref:C6 zinc finger protein n=1 Tax=Colletotrichum fioriniae PJ7 TaxID=1445577 RepID=A0A010S3R7_9PEZI|nr:C6 zinc finger protein [Colletotrichum fioriniae PJ7]
MTADKPAPSPTGVGAGSRTHKSCDACKSRKVRCPIAGQLLPTNYSPSSNRPPSLPDAKAVLDLSTSDGETKPLVLSDRRTSPKSPPHRIQELHVDRVLARAQRPKTSTGRGQEETMFVPISNPQRNGIFGIEAPHALSGLHVLTDQGGRNSLTFFSDNRLLSLSTRLQNQKVNELVGRISVIVNGRLRRTDSTTTNPRRTQPPDMGTDRARAALYIRLYFERVHPMFPFLDRTTFETTVSSPNFPNLLERSKPWCCLYHSVLALGSQYADGGTFEPGKGESWRLFSVSLSGFSELLLLPDSLTTLQALTAMSVYGLGISGLAVEPVIMSEAARRAQMMSSHSFTGPTAHAYQKSFWILYAVEKITSFHFGRSSGFVDSDISCPIPVVPEATSGDFSWFLHLVRFARLLSRAYTSLFSVGVSGNSDSYYLDVIDQLNGELEEWRASLPDNGFRPGGILRPQTVSGPNARSLALILHYLYYSMLLTLARTTLCYLPVPETPAVTATKDDKMKTILNASRAILELTTMIEVEPYTVTCRIEYASGGTVPGSLIAEFAKIARDYVNEIQHAEVGLTNPARPHAPTNPSAMQMVQQSSELDAGNNKQVARPTQMTLDLSDTMPREAMMSGPMQQPGYTDFAFDSGMGQVSPSALMGTDVMGIFNYFLPDLDPMFYQGMTQEYDLLPQQHGGTVQSMDKIDKQILMASESPASQASTPAGDKPRNVLACVFCHQRKIKCDRKSPCANCIKSDQPCVPSTRAPPGAGRRRVVKDLLERLNQCESLLSQVAPRDADGRPVNPDTPGSSRDVADSPAMSHISYEEARKQPSSRPNGKIVCDEGRPTFMENPFRGNVLDHLQFSKLSLEDNDAEQSTNPSGSTSVSERGDSIHQKSMDFDILALGPVEVLRLWQVFLERVNPMIKVIHVPSLEPLVFEAATDRFNLSPDLEALLCSINVVAIMALSEAESIQMLKLEKAKALRNSMSALKKAMSKVDFLRKYNMTTLQCLVLYLVSLQGQFDRHAAWVLTGMLVRIAQRMGLHRDGELIGLQPFETEMRRRIWWQIIMLETKYAVLAGFGDTLLPPNWDAKLPSNVNDADLLPGSAEPVKSRDGATEMAFCLMLYESRAFFCDNPMPEFESVILSGDKISPENSKKFSGQPHILDRYRLALNQYDERLAAAERRFCNPTAGGIHLVASKIRSFTAQRMRDMIMHAREPWDENKDGGASQQSFFRAWVISFESDVSWYDTIDDKFTWYLKLHFQSDAFSVMIELLQWQPVGTLVDRAWKAIDRLYHHHPEMYDLSRKDNMLRAENLLAGWARRELAFRNLGMSCDTPLVVARFRSSEVFKQKQPGGLPVEQWPAPTPDTALFSDMSPSDFETFDGGMPGDTHGPNFSLWGGGGPGQHAL